MDISGNAMRAPHIVACIVLLMLSISVQAQVEATITYFHSDFSGSPVAATSETGAVLWRTDYLPYGHRYSTSQSANNDVWFTGHIEDNPSGLVYMQARYYDPDIGRFHGVDRLGFVESNPMSFNRYAYGNNNPYKFVDPDGNSPKLAVDFALNVAFNYVTTGKLSLTSAAKESALGALNPLKTLQTARKLGTAVTKSVGPKVGGGGTLDKLTPGEIKRIQNAANRSGQDIGVVGSRVNPNKPLHANSDYDFVVDANSKTRNNLSRSLPGAKNVREGTPGNQDIFKGSVDTNKPHAIFRPE